MRCPKCQYIGFDDGDRCRNCGYDFSLVQAEAPLDLPMRQDEAAGPLADLGLRAAPGRAVTPSGASGVQREASRTPRRPLTPGGFDLPLFGDGDDAPLVRTTATPRPPLAVRRAAPVTPRPRVDPIIEEEPALEFPESDAHAYEHVAAASAHTREAGDAMSVASPATRLAGAAVDALLLGGIDAAVVYFTLRLCGLEIAEIRALPVVPMVAFFALLNGGYLIIFTASGGQTIGKMLAGTRVVPAGAADGSARISFGSAAARAAACVLSLLPAGLGFGMALFRPDGRALHDAIADTRVIDA